MKLGSLFSGGGLGDFGFMASGMEIAWQCEIDEYCQKILSLRYPDSKKYRDIKTLKGSELEKVDIITGGFPWQPFSVAGQQMGKSDDRHLWPEMFRIIQEVKPRWVVGENVSGFVDMALDDVCANLESAGYEVGTLIFPAHALGAWHRRERVWIIANSRHAESQEWGPEKKRKLREAWHESSPHISYVADAQSTECSKSMYPRPRRNRPTRSSQTLSNARLLGQEKRQEQATGIEQCGEIFRRWWSTEPAVGRVANGITSRLHRLKMLGNGQVPACTYVIGKMIMDIEKGLQNDRK